MSIAPQTAQNGKYEQFESLSARRTHLRLLHLLAGDVPKMAAHRFFKASHILQIISEISISCVDQLVTMK